MNHDSRYMEQALSLAQAGLGLTWPNPSVGAVIVKDGQVIGTGATAKGGRPHAETEALAQAGAKAQDATLYVTLEPCSHIGKTPPCTEAIINAQIARVFVACTDPDPRVNGAGIAALKAAGIEVNVGLYDMEASLLNEGYFKRVTENRPLVHVKIATSLDGRIASASGESKWITGEEAREHTHRLRGEHDAILVGIGTVLADNPLLTCRAKGMESRTPVRIVIDSRLRMPLECRLTATAREYPTWVVTTKTSKISRAERVKKLEKAGVILFDVGSEQATRLFAHNIATTAGAAMFHTEGVEERTHLREMLECLAINGITRLLVEAGGTLATNFLHQQMADRLYWYRAPIVIGEEGAPAFQSGFSGKLDELPRMMREALVPVGNDVLEIYRFRH